MAQGRMGWMVPVIIIIVVVVGGFWLYKELRECKQDLGTCEEDLKKCEEPTDPDVWPEPGPEIIVVPDADTGDLTYKIDNEMANKVDPLEGLLNKHFFGYAYTFKANVKYATVGSGEVWGDAWINMIALSMVDGKIIKGTRVWCEYDKGCLEWELYEDGQWSDLEKRNYDWDHRRDLRNDIFVELSGVEIRYKHPVTGKENTIVTLDKFKELAVQGDK